MRNLRTARPVAKLVQGRRDWYEIKNLSDSQTELFIYDEIGYFGVSASDMIRDLMGIQTPDLSVRINSPGGDAFDGVAIYNALKQFPGHVDVTIDSLAASAASFIAMAGDTITMQPNSQMMIHDAAGICIGNALDMQKMTDLLGQCSDNIASIYAARAGGTSDEWRTVMQAETWYTAQEAVDAGLADKVGAYPAKATNDWDLSIYAGRTHPPAPVDRPVDKDRMEWNVVNHPSDSKSGTCPQCDEAADGGPYFPKSSAPTPPIHPNCECTLEPVKVVRLENDTQVDFDAESFRQMMRKAFA